MRSVAFVIKAEVRDAPAKTFAFVAQKTMYGGKHIAKSDTVFVFASENEGGQGLIERGVVTSAEASRDALIRQVTGAVRWEPSVRLLIDMGVGPFIEVGPGKVLWGLMRQIDRSKSCMTVGDEASLQKTLAQIAAMAA